MLHAQPMSVEKNEMGRVCSTYGGEERHIQGFVGETWGTNGLDQAGIGLGQLAGMCECSNEPSGSTKCEEFLDWLRTETIQQIAYSNNFPINILHKLKERTHQQLSQPATQKKKKGTKWATFTYTTPHIRKITNMFKNTDIKIAFKTNNTLRQLTKPPHPHPNPSTRMQWYLCTHMQYLPNDVCRTDQPKPKNLL